MAVRTSSSRQHTLAQELEKKLQSITEKGSNEDALALASNLGLQFSDLHAIPVDDEAIATLNEDAAREAQIASVYRNKNALVVVARDPRLPETAELLHDLEKRGFSIKIIITTAEALERVWQRYQGMHAAKTFEVGAVRISDQRLNELRSAITNLEDLKRQVTKVPTTQLLEMVLAGGLKTEASDIHLEPEQSSTRLRYRIDGLLDDIAALDAKTYKKILDRVKVLAGLKLNIHDTPQDGRFTIQRDQRPIEVRVSVLPSEYGETIVMRLLDPRTIRNKLEDLGMRPEVLSLLRDQLKKPTGAIFTTGPTGSGKTTTLYACVRALNSRDSKIITIEDPIEYHVEGISQTQVQPDKGYTFANGLRAIVRQDPDVILVGEVRDAETADIALHAALTGHLVLSTLHTNDASGTVPRLIDLDVKPQSIPPALNLAIAQRLVRKLCPSCKKPLALNDQQRTRVKTAFAVAADRTIIPEIEKRTTIYEVGGCEKCNGLGYKGRIGVFEAFSMTRSMEKLVLASAPSSEIRDLAVKEGMVTLLQDGYLKMLEGVTSFNEIERVLGG